MNLFIARDKAHYRRWLNALPGLLIPGSAQFISGGRLSGPIKRERIVGKAFYVYAPAARKRWIE